MLGKNKNKAPESEMQIARKEFKIAYLLGILVASVLVAIKMINRQPWTDSFAILTAMFTGQNFYAWYKDRTKKDKLIYVGLYLFFTILLIATYFLEITK
ncbi:DUF6442 family protein [Alterileibacterium massiliense]|uniref:DUF6442 family protein n=1 Tax=Alterileibacterium massiliense TaxID=1870997 RepID=UPI0008D90A63|nr:DUF6442 family protein [Alterileibacterium massiliense]